MKIVFFLQIYIFILGVFSCNVTEEGKSFEIRFTTKSSPEDGLMLSWYKDDKLLADCPVDTGDCTTVDVNWFHANVDRQNDSVEFIVNIPNVSRNSSSNAKGLWTLKTHSSSPISEILYTCMLQVYAKPDQVNCDAKWTTDELTIRCKTNRIYPEAMMKVDIKNKPSTVISCENTRISIEPYNYRAECTFRIPTKDFHFKKNEVDIYIYPNIIGFYNRIGVNVSIDVTLETCAVQAKICVDREKYINCRCVKLDERHAVKYVDWLLNNTAVSSKGFQANFIKTQTDNNDMYLGFKLISCNLRWDNDHKDLGLLYVVIVVVALCVLSTATLSFVLWRRSKKKNKTFDKTTVDDAESSESYKCETINNHADEITSFLESNGKDKNQVPKELVGDPNTKLENPTRDAKTEAVPPDDSKKHYDDSMIDVKSVLLLLKTLNANEADITKTVFQSNIKRVDANNKNIQLDYFQHKDRIFKVVNVPGYNEKNKIRYLQMLNNSICLSPEGYSAFIMVFTPAEYKDAYSIIYMLVEVFGKDVLNYLMVFLLDDRHGTFYQNDIKRIIDLCDGRYFVCDSNSDVLPVIHTFVVDMNYLYVNNSFKMRFEKSQSYTGIMLENIIQDICLLIHSTESVEKREKRKDCLIRNWANMKNKMDPSTYRFDDIEYLIDFCVKENCEAGITQTNSQQISEDFEKCLEYVKYDHIRKLIFDRKNFLGNIFNLDEIYLTCVHS